MTTPERGNKLIAEFMGCQIDKDNATMHVWIHGDEPTFFYCEWHPELKLENERVLAWEFAPDKNWCQLMAVVEKINNIKGFDVIIWKYDCHINDEREILFEQSGNPVINAVWRAVVQFIQWHRNP